MQMCSTFAACSQPSRKASEVASDLLSTFAAIAVRRGVDHDSKLEWCPPSELADRLVHRARLRDLTLFPLQVTNEDHQRIVEQLIFDSGRPVIVFPDDQDRDVSASFRNIAVAWDFSRSATRALADALPLLQAAESVRIFVVDDKVIQTSTAVAALLDHLTTHDVQASFEEVTSDTRSIGEVIEAYVAEHRIDLLVMGAYGHSRLREFILGGATRSVLGHPPTWVLLSH
jgi:nucleotide-binding universal stress UspA family protein